MRLDSAIDEEGAQLYIDMIECDSPEAAAVLRRIAMTVGDPIALQAARVLTVLKDEVRETHTLPTFRDSTYSFRDYPEALAGVEEALHYCLSAWRLRPSVSFSFASIHSMDASNAMHPLEQ